MKKGEVYTGTVERMDFPNRGIVTIDGETAVVKNALPGQVVTFAVNKKRGGRFEGRLLQVEKDSPLEKTEGRCAHFGVCGGCLCQSLPYEEQLKIKEAQIRRLMDGVCQGDYSFEGILGSPLPEGYRNKMEFSFGDAYKGGPLELGMHRRGSFHDVVSAEGCRIVHEDFSCILAETRAYFADLGVGFYRKLQHTGYLRHLLVRRAVKTGEILTALVTTGQNGLLPANPGENAEEAQKNGEDTAVFFLQAKDHETLLRQFPVLYFPACGMELAGGRLDLLLFERDVFHRLIGFVQQLGRRVVDLVFNQLQPIFFSHFAPFPFGFFFVHILHRIGVIADAGTIL